MIQTNLKNELTLAIDSLSNGPYGIGHLEGKTILIPVTAPGDTVAARVLEDKERYSVAEVARLIHASPVRQVPPCPYAGECGGCPWQHVRYDAELAAKQKNVGDALRRIGRLADFELLPIIASPLQYNYRRRIRLQRRGKRLGLFRAFSHELVEIDSCLIADDRLNQVLEELGRWSSLPATDIEHLEVVSSDDGEQVVVSGKAIGEFERLDRTVCEDLVARCGRISGLILRAANWRRTWGNTAVSVIPEAGVHLSIEADVFTQVNSVANRELLSHLLARAAFQPAERVLELYSGAGNFTLPMARRVAGVVAVEGYLPAVESGRRSAQSNGIGNIRWIRAPVAAALAKLAKAGERFSKIVLDPPSTGAKGIERDLASLGADEIFYISCNPATLARDLAALSKHGYRLRTVQPLDLFPHTFHVEALAVLTR